jgi:peptidoglycan/LPS O-acetylase OafA/YrhL
LLGFLAYRFRDHIPRTWSIIVAAFFVLLLLVYQHLPVFDWLNPNGANMVLYLAFPVALPAIFHLGQRLPFERVIGDLSYPIYICHMPVECVLYTLRVHKMMTLYPWIALNIFAVIATASLLLYVTGPIERFRQAFKRRRLSRLKRNALVSPDEVAPAAVPRSAAIRSLAHGQSSAAK